MSGEAEGFQRAAADMRRIVQQPLAAQMALHGLEFDAEVRQRRDGGRSKRRQDGVIQLGHGHRASPGSRGQGQAAQAQRQLGVLVERGHLNGAIGRRAQGEGDFARGFQSALADHVQDLRRRRARLARAIGHAPTDQGLREPGDGERDGTVQASGAGFERQGHGPQASEGGQACQVGGAFGEEGFDGERRPGSREGDTGRSGGLRRDKQHLSRFPRAERGPPEGGRFSLAPAGDSKDRNGRGCCCDWSGWPGRLAGARQGDGVADQPVGGAGVARRSSGAAEGGVAPGIGAGLRIALAAEDRVHHRLQPGGQHRRGLRGGAALAQSGLTGGERGREPRARDGQDRWR